MKAKDLIKLLKKKQDADVQILGYRSHPVKIEAAYYDKDQNRFIIETD